MKKLYVSLAAMLGISLTSTAQFTMTSSNTNPSDGQSYTLFIADSGKAESGTAGMGQLWDFSGVETYDSTDAVWANFSTTSPIDPFYAIGGINPTWSLTYHENINYYRNGANSLEMFGRCTRYGGAYQPMPWNVVVDLYAYDFDYQQASSGTVTFSYNTLNGSFPFTGDVTGTVKAEYDGQGELILPDGRIINDVARIKVTERYLRGAGGSIARINNTFYEYREEFTPMWVARIESYDVKDTTSSKHLYYDKSYFMKGSQVQNVSELIENSDPFVVYPNPSADYANIDFELNGISDVMISVTDIIGNELVVFNQSKMYRGKYQEKIDLTEYSKGYYLIKLKVNGNISAQKIQKL